MSASPVVALVHLGCARNLIDSELILARLAEEGCAVSGDVAEAEVAILNTCSFIGPARQESEDAIRGLLDRKRRGELASVVVAGCLVQRFQKELLRRFPEVDLFAEISDYRELARSVRSMPWKQAGAHGPSYLAAGGLRAAVRDDGRLLATPGSYAYLRISHGCDHTCSFCAIPSIRGPHRSKPVEALVAEARELIERGVRELVLVAEDSTAWGRDLGLELPRLVETLADLEGEHRLRLMYAYPNRFPWELLALLREHPRVEPYLDIPVQHVSTPVLRAMRRAGSGDQVRRILDRILEEVPGVTLRTTVLVGFPGETEADVLELVEFVRAYRLGRLGAFAYSREEGTASWDLAEQVPEEVASERQRLVLETRDEVLRQTQRELIGAEVEVLIDEEHAGRCVGHTSMDAPEVDPLTILPAAAGRVGERVLVKVRDVDAESNLVCEAATRRRA